MGAGDRHLAINLQVNIDLNFASGLAGSQSMKALHLIITLQDLANDLEIVFAEGGVGKAFDCLPSKFGPLIDHKEGNQDGSNRINPYDMGNGGQPQSK